MTLAPDADFYALESLLDDAGRDLLRQVREFMEKSVQPVINDYWILLENQVGRFVADAEAIYSYEGTREINTLIVGRAITGLSAFV